MSCKGCLTCDCIYEMISEYGVDELIGGEWKDGEMVELSIEHDRGWTDCGWEYDSWLEWKRVDGNVS